MGEWKCAYNISTHAPRTGSDANVLAHIYAYVLFQPTLPARGATAWHIALTGSSDFNPRSPHGERQCRKRRIHAMSVISTHAPRTGSDSLRPAPRLCLAISTHAPRTGSDDANKMVSAPFPHFNPRSPHGERQTQQRAEQRHILISTHAPRTGSDAAAGGRGRGTEHFNPRSPHGERPMAQAAETEPVAIFQPTLPARGATLRSALFITMPPDFNPRSPHGERPFARLLQNLRNGISTHAPRTGSDDTGFRCRKCRRRFQPTLPARGATRRWREKSCKM